MRLCHHPAPGLDQRERGAPASLFLKLVLGVLPEPAQLLRADVRQQSWFQTDAELQGQPQVGMSRREGQDLGASRSPPAAAAKELKMVTPGLGITPAYRNASWDEGDQLLGPLRRWVEVPGSPIGIF